MGNACVAGVCTVNCPNNQTNCNGSCVNLQTDSQNCNACGTVCPNGNVCVAGVCGISCQQALTNCNGVCANLVTDNANCGGCAKVCPMGTMCSNSACNVTCLAPTITCSGACVDARFDPANCGGCGAACAAANGTPACLNSKCIIGACKAGYADCDGVSANGCESVLGTDANNCGKCGTVCPNNLPVCKAGVCSTAATVYGPNHTFLGITTDFYLSTGQGCCSVGCNGNQAVDAAYFCQHFYATPLGKTCTVTSAGTQVNAAAASGYMLHKNGGCTSSGTDIPNVLCDVNATPNCKLWQTLGQAYGGLKGIVCTCM